MEIANELTDIDDQLSKLDLLWLDEQRRTIAALGDEIIALNKEKEQKGIQIGQHKERIRQLDYEVLPDHYFRLLCCAWIRSRSAMLLPKECIPRCEQVRLLLRTPLSTALSPDLNWRGNSPWN